MSFFTPNITVSNPIPQEVKIYYSKDFATFHLCLSLVVVGVGIFWLTSGHLFIGAITSLAALYFIVLRIRHLLDKKPQIIINTSGIQTAATPFYKWSEITEERVSGNYEGRGARPMLEYIFPGGEEHKKVEPLNIRPHELNILLKYYRKHCEFRNNE
jgi:hypothetical protein